MMTSSQTTDQSDWRTERKSFWAKISKPSPVIWLVEQDPVTGPRGYIKGGFQWANPQKPKMADGLSLSAAALVDDVWCSGPFTPQDPLFSGYYGGKVILQSVSSLGSCLEAYSGLCLHASAGRRRRRSQPRNLLTGGRGVRKKCESMHAHLINCVHTLYM